MGAAPVAINRCGREGWERTSGKLEVALSLLFVLFMLDST
jgi:hypothetical protein